MGKIVRKPSNSIDGVKTEMVKCSSCSLNIPKADAYRKNDLWYCKKENYNLYRTFTVKVSA